MSKDFEEKTTKKLSEIGSELSKVNKKLSEHDKHFTDHDAKFDRVFNKLLDHDKKFERIFDKFISLEGKINNVESGLGAKIDQFQDRILSAIDGVVKKNSDIEVEQLSTRVTLDRHQDEIDLNKKEITKIKKAIKIA